MTDADSVSLLLGESIAPTPTWWQCDPESSESDWTIRVLSQSSNNCGNSIASDETKNEDYSILSDDPLSSEQQLTVYHVHKARLTTGCRYSEYFRAIFSNRTEDGHSTNNSTRLVLPESACLAFPRFLDYLYEDKAENEFYGAFDLGAYLDQPTLVQEEVIMAFFAEQFRVPSLLARTKARITPTINTSNLCLVARGAVLDGNIEWVLDECIQIAARYLNLLENHHNDNKVQEFLAILPPQRQAELWRRSLSYAVEVHESIQQEYEKKNKTLVKLVSHMRIKLQKSQEKLETIRGELKSANLKNLDRILDQMKQPWDA